MWILTFGKCLYIYIWWCVVCKTDALTLSKRHNWYIFLGTCLASLSPSSQWISCRWIITLWFLVKKISFGMFYIAATTNCRGGKPLWRWVSKNLFHIHPIVSSPLITCMGKSMRKAVDQLPLLSTQISLILYWKGSCQSLIPWGHGPHVLHTWAFGSMLIGLHSSYRKTTWFQQDH